MENKTHKTFKPFERVLVRDYYNKWYCGFYSHWCNTENSHVLSSTGYYEDDEILPYEGNEHLVGTSKLPDEEVELKENSICLFSNNRQELESGFGTMARFRSISGFNCLMMKESFHTYYANNFENNYYYCIPISEFNPDDLEETRKHILHVNNGKIVRLFK